MTGGAMTVPLRCFERNSKRVVSPKSSSRYAPSSMDSPKISGTGRPWRRKWREKSGEEGVFFRALVGKTKGAGGVSVLRVSCRDEAPALSFWGVRRRGGGGEVTSQSRV